jgi:hypothetical protein
LPAIPKDAQDFFVSRYACVITMRPVGSRLVANDDPRSRTRRSSIFGRPYQRMPLRSHITNP